jgi:hypothetical protein
MDEQVTSIYCLTDDFLHDLRHAEPEGCTVSDAEVLTVALTAARFFDGNYAAAWRFLTSHRYLMQSLSPGQFSRRLGRLTPVLWALFGWLGQLWKRTGSEGVFVVDSCPVACCDNARIRRSRLYPLEETGGAFRGYIASKRRFFYGVRVHALVNEHGLPVEAHLTPGSASDTAELKNFALDLPAGSVVYGDKAYNEYLTEDLLDEAGDVELLPQRKKNSRRRLPAWVEYLQQHYRKVVETSFSSLERLLPKSIHAVTARGFELKVFLFVLTLSLEPLLYHTT